MQLVDLHHAIESAPESQERLTINHYIEVGTMPY